MKYLVLTISVVLFYLNGFSDESKLQDLENPLLPTLLEKQELISKISPWDRFVLLNEADANKNCPKQIQIVSDPLYSESVNSAGDKLISENTYGKIVINKVVNNKSEVFKTINSAPSGVNIPSVGGGYFPYEPGRLIIVNWGILRILPKLKFMIGYTSSVEDQSQKLELKQSFFLEYEQLNNSEVFVTFLEVFPKNYACSYFKILE